MVYTFDTYHGSSGSPVFFAKEGEGGAAGCASEERNNTNDG